MPPLILDIPLDKRYLYISLQKEKYISKTKQKKETETKSIYKNR